MRNLITVMLLIFSFSVFAQVGQKINATQWAYYGQDFYNGKPTKDSIGIILNAIHSSAQGKFDAMGSSCTGPNCYQHTSVGYDGARNNLFGKIYVLSDAKGTFINDVYCQKNIYFNTVGEASGMHSTVNIEHTWPQSKFSTRFDKSIQKSDMNHLFLTDSVANSDRGNFEFGDLSGVANEIHAQNCSVSAVGRINGDRIFMPPVRHRGNVARALFYFATHYGLTISDAQEKVLRIWHKADPADTLEIARHEMIAGIQKVRNPFIDHPELVDQISNF